MVVWILAQILNVLRVPGTRTTEFALRPWAAWLSKRRDTNIRRTTTTEQIDHASGALCSSSQRGNNMIPKPGADSTNTCFLHLPVTDRTPDFEREPPEATSSSLLSPAPHRSPSDSFTEPEEESGDMTNPLELRAHYAKATHVSGVHPITDSAGDLEKLPDRFPEFAAHTFAHGEHREPPDVDPKPVVGNRDQRFAHEQPSHVS